MISRSPRRSIFWPVICGIQVRVRKAWDERAKTIASTGVEDRQVTKKPRAAATR
jgi:hypothetical protein